MNDATARRKQQRQTCNRSAQARLVPAPTEKEDEEEMRRSPLQTIDRIDWLKSRVPARRFLDRTVKLKYIKPLSEMNEYSATKKVFNRFDGDGNRKSPED